jgi:hypothetical protein
MLPSFDELSKRRRFRYREMVERGGWRFMLVFYLVLIVILIIVAVPSIEAYGLGRLKTNFQAQQCSPVISTSGDMVAGTIAGMFYGDVLAAAADIVTGLNVQGLMTMRNPTFVPFYVPATSHRLAITGEETTKVVWTGGMWLAPGSSEPEVISLGADLHDLPEAALRSLAYGGNIKIEIVSEIHLGQFSVTKTTTVFANVSQPLSSYMK